MQKQLTAKIVSQKASSEMFDRALNNSLSDVSRGLQCGKKENCCGQISYPQFCELNPKL